MLSRQHLAPKSLLVKLNDWDFVKNNSGCCGGNWHENLKEMDAFEVVGVQSRPAGCRTWLLEVLVADNRGKRPHLPHIVLDLIQERQAPLTRNVQDSSWAWGWMEFPVERWFMWGAQWDWQNFKMRAQNTDRLVCWKAHQLSQVIYQRSWKVEGLVK